MIAAVTMFKDEADILPLTVANMAAQVDLVIASDNMSTDGSADTIRGLPNVELVEDNEPGYWQADKMTALAARAAGYGAEWIVPFDADELWTGLDVLNSWTVADVVRVRPHVFLGDRDLGVEPFPKVCFKWHPDARLHMGNHGVDHPGADDPRCDLISVRHFQYRSLAQVRRKVRQGVEAYDATTLGPEFGSHWRRLAAMSDAQLEQWWDEYAK